MNREGKAEILNAIGSEYGGGHDGAHQSSQLHWIPDICYMKYRGI